MPPVAGPLYLRREVVSLGLCEIAGGKKGGAWAFVEPGDKVGETFAMDRRKMKGTIGSVYTVPVSADGTSFKSGELKWARNWPNADDLIFWRAKSDALEVKERVAATKAKGEKMGLAKAMSGLEPLKIAYWSTDKTGRLALEVLVLQYLRDGRI